MNPCRIQYPRVSATLLMLLLMSISNLLPSRLCAQSGCSGTLGSFSYDTVVIRTDPQTPLSFDYHVPQFPTSQLSLFALVTQSQIGVNPSLTIRNLKGSTAGGAFIGIYRSDDAFNNATGEDAFGSNTFNKVWTIPVLADQQQATLTATHPATGYTILYDSLTTTDHSLDNGSYVGWGLQDYTYTLTTSLNMPSYYSVLSYSDTVAFSVTYYYCNPGTLANDILSFTATKQNGSVLLGWNTTNEQANRTYKIQVSSDGVSFNDCAGVDSDPVNGDASYTYSYPVDPSRSGRLYFRLRILDESGAVHYSVIRIIDLDRGMQPVKKGFYIYPNPATDFISLNIPGNDLLPWQVDIIAADGRLVQRNLFTNTNTPRIDFRRKLAAGAYFVRAVNEQMSQRYTGSFVIRR